MSAGQLRYSEADHDDEPPAAHDNYIKLNKRLQRRFATAAAVDLARLAVLSGQVVATVGT